MDINLTPATIVIDIVDRIAAANIGECNGHFQRMVVGKILERGKDIDDMTVGELRGIVSETETEFTEMMTKVYY